MRGKLSLEDRDGGGGGEREEGYKLPLPSLCIFMAALFIGGRQSDRALKNASLNIITDPTTFYFLMQTFRRD